MDIMYNFTNVTPAYKTFFTCIAIVLWTALVTGFIGDKIKKYFPNVKKIHLATIISALIVCFLSYICASFNVFGNFIADAIIIGPVLAYLASIVCDTKKYRLRGELIDGLKATEEETDNKDK